MLKKQNFWGLFFTAILIMGHLSAQEIIPATANKLVTANMRVTSFNMSFLATANNTPAADTMVLANEFIKIIVNQGPIDQGRFALETTHGDPNNPNDDNQPLIFGRPIPWTSYTTVMIDGAPYVFGGINKKIEKRSGAKIKFGVCTYQEKTDSEIITKCQFDSISVTQHLSFFRNPSTRVKDTMLISYSIENQDQAPHTIGLRVMMDTKLGANDGAPFRIGDQALETEKQFTGSSLSDYWQTFDSLVSPNVIAQGSVRHEELGIAPPDKMYLVNWGTLVDNPWDFAYEEGRSFVRDGELEKDTALALYWQPVTIAPNGQRAIKTLYGMGGISMAAGTLSLGIAAPAEVYAGTKKEVLIMGYLANTSGYDAHNTVATFQLPKGMVPVKGKLINQLGDIKAGETRQIAVNAVLKEAIPGPQKISLKITSATLEDNRIERRIDILAPGKLKAEWILPKEKVITDNPFIDAILLLENNTSHNIDDIVMNLNSGPACELPQFDIAKKSLVSLDQKNKKVIHWKLRLKESNRHNIPLKVSLKTEAGVSESFSGTIELVKPDAVLILKPSKPKTTVGGYLYVDVIQKGYTPESISEFTIIYNDNLLKWMRTSLDKKWRDKIEYLSEPNQMRLILKTPMALTPSLLARIHFKCIAAGETEVILKTNNQAGSAEKIKINERIKTEEKINEPSKPAVQPKADEKTNSNEQNFIIENNINEGKVTPE